MSCIGLDYQCRGERGLELRGSMCSQASSLIEGPIKVIARKEKLHPSGIVQMYSESDDPTKKA